MTDIKYDSVILMGQTGCGKGTQSALLAKELGYEIFSTGDKSREYAAMDTPLGRVIARMHTVGWIPEWLASYLMTKALLEDFAHQGLVFESVARKLPEAEKLHEIHESIERSYVVIYMECHDDIVRERQLARGREGYDNPENVARRMKAFEDETLASLSFFSDKGKVIKINADEPIEDVFESIMVELKK